MVEVERKAGYGMVIALSITAMIGTGLFFGPAIAAGLAGNASLLAWAFLGLLTIYVGFCFAELSSMFPDSGGVYEFSKKAYGRFPSFMVGWVTWLVGSVTPVVLLVAAIDTLFPQQSLLVRLGIVIGLIILLNYITYRGVDASTAVLLFFAITTVLVVLTIIITAFLKSPAISYGPLITPDFLPLSLLAVLFFLVESFFGWESATFMGSETKNPERTIPRSIIITSVLTAALGFAFAAALLAFLPAEQLAALPQPFTDVATMLFGPLGAMLATVALAIALVGSAAGGIISSPRLILALAKDKLFVEQFSAIHPRRQTPHKAILFQTVISIIITILTFGDYRTALALLVPLALLMYVPVLLTVPILRWKYPHKERHPRILFGAVGPVLVSLVYLGMIVAWFLTGAGAHTIFYNVLILISFGIPIYLLLNVYYNPELLLKTMDSLAPLHWFFEGVLLPKRVRKEVVGLFKGLEGKNVLEFGSGVGAFTMHLAKLVGKDGNIYAVDYSSANIRILERRLKKSGHAQVHLIHDEHFISRVHPSVPHVDFVYSIGNLSYVQDVKRVLQDMHAILPENGRICFVEYVDYFWGLIPNPPWLDRHEHIESLFHGLGFSVRVKRRRGLFWNHLYIYGIKSDRDVPVI